MSDEEVEVFGRADRLRIAPGRRWNAGGRCVPAAGRVGGDVLRVEEEDPERICAARSTDSDRRRQQILALNCLKTWPTPIFTRESGKTVLPNGATSVCPAPRDAGKPISRSHRKILSTHRDKHHGRFETIRRSVGGGSEPPYSYAPRSGALPL